MIKKLILLSMLFMLLVLNACKREDTDTSKGVNDSNVAIFVKDNFDTEKTSFDIPLRLTISATPLNSFGAFSWTRANPSNLPKPLSHILIECGNVNTGIKSMKAGDTAVLESSSFMVYGINSGHQYQINVDDCTIR